MPDRGEVWQVDFGITQKVRPALVISIPYTDTDRALIGVIPHTTATRGSQFEVSLRTTFLTEGAFLVQGIQALPEVFLAPAWRTDRRSVTAGRNSVALLAGNCNQNMKPPRPRQADGY